MTRFLRNTILAGSAAILFLPIAALAQQGQTPDNPSGQSQSDIQGENRQRRFGAMQRQRQHMAALAEKLNLTDAQKKQFQEISQSMWKQGRAIRQDSSLSEDQKKEKMQALRKQSHQQMFGVLTQEQKDQLKQMREQHQKDQEKSKTPGDQASGKSKPGAPADDDDPFAGMTSDDDDGPNNGGF